MNIFISGGCKNGKSMYAQKLAKEMADARGRALYYIATMIPTDEEDHKRIEKHIDDRCGWGFKTLEQGINICDLLKTNIDPQGAFLLDSFCPTKCLKVTAPATWMQAGKLLQNCRRLRRVQETPCLCQITSTLMPEFLTHIQRNIENHWLMWTGSWRRSAIRS